MTNHPEDDDNSHIEADDDIDDADSTLGSDATSETQTLDSLVARYETENGRRYHAYKAGHYAFPNDELELDRMDFEHHLFLTLLDHSYHSAPLESPQRILDLGTGTGIWAIDMADLYPMASVIGTDLSPVQPSFVPPNLQFQVDDFEREWNYSPSSFDLIHTRLLLASISDYPQLLRRAFKHLKPGGYLEMHDIDPGFYSDDDTIPADSAAAQWSQLFFEGCEKIGHRVPVASEYRTLFQEAGYVDITVRIEKRPTNYKWPKSNKMKEIGAYTLKNHLDGIHGFSIGLFTRALGWSPEEVEVFLIRCREEWQMKSIHAYQKVVFIYGRKPLDAE